MAFDIENTNLLDMRKSERKRLSEKLLSGNLSDLDALWRKVENTLSRYKGVFPENEEQIYLFGLAIKDLVAPLQKSSSPSFRDHSDQEIHIIFTGGFLGLSFKDTLEALKADRKNRGKQHREKVVESKTRQIETRITLKKDIEDVVASLVPSERGYDR